MQSYYVLFLSVSIFNIVTFPNDPCDAGSKNGTCYTKYLTNELFKYKYMYGQNSSFSFREECSNKGGTNDGSCASGYGVCCSCNFCLKQLMIKFTFSLFQLRLDVAKPLLKTILILSQEVLKREDALIKFAPAVTIFAK